MVPLSWMDLLCGGDRKSIGNAVAVAEGEILEPHRLEELLICCTSPDATVCSRASYALMVLAKKEPQLLEPSISKLLATVASSDQWEMRAHFCQTITKLRLKDHHVKEALSHFTQYLEDNRSFVKTAAMQGLVDLCAFDSGIVPFVRRIVAELSLQGTPAMRARGRKLLAFLNKHYPKL